MDRVHVVSMTAHVVVCDHSAGDGSDYKLQVHVNFFLYKKERRDDRYLFATRYYC